MLCHFLHDERIADQKAHDFRRTVLYPDAESSGLVEAPTTAIALLLLNTSEGEIIDDTIAHQH